MKIEIVVQRFGHRTYVYFYRSNVEIMLFFTFMHKALIEKLCVQDDRMT